MWNFSSSADGELDYDVGLWNFTAVNINMSLSPTSALSAQRYCTATLSFAINTVGAGLVCLFGLVGNSLSILVIGDDPKASAVTVLLLQSLAVADNFFLAVWLVQSFPLLLRLR